LKGNIMALPNGAGGYQLGDGNIGEVQLGTQAAPAAYTAAATLVAADLTNGIITLNNGSDQNLQLPTVATLENTVSSAKVNSSFVFSVLALGAGGATLTTNTGWTLVGASAKVTTANRFLARKTGDGTWSLYLIG
jgi:hypothetical protein